jgi:hypothetical protein
MPSSVINSDDGVISGTSGLKSSGGDDGALAVQSNGTEVAKFKTTELVINDGGANYDFRVEGDTNANMLFVDASADAVGIGTSSTSAARLTVRGAGTTSSTASLELATSGGATRLYVRDDGATSFYGSSNAETMRITSGGDLQFNSGYGSVATAYGCRAWVNFNGTNTVAIRASGNVSSITDNGTGDYTVNFTTAMPDTNYGVALTIVTSATSVGYLGPGIRAATSYLIGDSMQTSSVRVVSKAAGLTDVDFYSVTIFR